MPEAPAQADTVFAAKHDLATDLADGKVDDRGVTGRAGESSGTPQDVRWPVGGLLAEGAREQGRW